LESSIPTPPSRQKSPKGIFSRKVRKGSKRLHPAISSGFWIPRILDSSLLPRKARKTRKGGGRTYSPCHLLAPDRGDSERTPTSGLAWHRSPAVSQPGGQDEKRVHKGDNAKNKKPLGPCKSLGFNGCPGRDRTYDQV